MLSLTVFTSLHVRTKAHNSDERIKIFVSTSLDIFHKVQTTGTEGFQQFNYSLFAPYWACCFSCKIFQNNQQKKEFQTVAFCRIPFNKRFQIEFIYPTRDSYKFYFILVRLLRKTFILFFHELYSESQNLIFYFTALIS